MSKTEVIKYDGHKVTISTGSSVWVGRSRDVNGIGVVLEKQPEGTRLEFGLTEEAAEALLHLLLLSGVDQAFRL